MIPNYAITQNFQSVIPNAVPTSEDHFDMRNLIYSRGSTFTLDAYLNYLKISKEIAMDAAPERSYMLWLGFIPLIMPPSFWGDKAHALIMPVLPKTLHFYPWPASSFRGIRYTSDYPDIWVSKLDAAELCNCKPENVTVEGVLHRCGL